MTTTLRRRILSISACMVALPFLIMNPRPARAQDTHLTASITPSYITGTYGTSYRTDIFYLPLTFKAQTGDLTLMATIPYIRVHTHGALVAGGTVVGSTGGKNTTTSGLGDIWLQGRYRLHLDNKGDSLSPYLKVKLGTASRSKGLGTGANDYEYGTYLNLRAGRQMFPFVQLGYRVRGQAPGFVLRNTVMYQAGLSYLVNPANIATVIYSGHSSSQPGMAAASMLIGAWNYRARHDTELQLYGLLGLSSGSPDYGGGLSYLYHF